MWRRGGHSKLKNQPEFSFFVFAVRSDFRLPENILTEYFDEKQRIYDENTIVIFWHDPRVGR